jgi:Tol biopolymer transport system component
VLKGSALFVLGAATALLTSAGGAAEGAARAGGGLIEFTSYRAGAHGIYVVRVDTGAVRLLASDTGTAVGATWSPDGRQLAFFRERDSVDGSCVRCVRLYVMDADGRRKRHLTSNDGGYGGAAWSPDGTLIAFDACDGDACAVCVIRPDGSALRRITPFGIDGEPVWSPDGARIAFDGTASDEEGIHVVAVDDGRVQRLTSDDDEGPRWSPDGTQIAFTRSTPLGHRDARTDLYVVAPDGSGLRRLTGPRRKQNYDPAWSPDGALLAFIGYREVPPGHPDTSAVYAMRPDGTMLRRLTRFGAAPTEPAWSPDGRQIAFLSRNDPDEFPIYVMAAHGGRARPLSFAAHAELDLAWQPTVSR